MSPLSRRTVLAAAALGEAAVLLPRPRPAAASEAGTAVPAAASLPPGDPRYDELTQRGFNSRFVCHPDTVRVVHSTDQVVRAVRDAVTAGKRLAVRGGGHGMEDLVDNDDVRLLIDMTEMRAVSYDAAHRAYSVQGGALLQDVYRRLYLDYGVTVPGGVCPTVGVGGHVSGGGYGPLCRRHGSIVDHLFGVEVVVVDADGTVRPVVATRDATDPNGDLWWAHTGGGGGNFGIVTRYLFRSPRADASTSAPLLPAPPAKMAHFSVSWSWDGLTQADFVGLVRNHGVWHERNSAPDSPYSKSAFQATFALNRAVVGTLNLEIGIDAGWPGAAGLVDDFLAAVNAGVTAKPTVTSRTAPWLKATLAGTFDTGKFERSKGKGAYLRRSWSTDQITTLYRYLTDPGFTGWGQVLLYSYGGQANAVASAATAMPQRDSVLKAYLWTVWTDPNLDAAHLAWIRGLYRDIYAGTGGVPAPNDANDGSYINYPDTDLLDPAWNRSGVPWYTLYYGGNFPRLQQVKRRWDPLNVFRHPLSVPLPA